MLSMKTWCLSTVLSTDCSVMLVSEVCVCECQTSLPGGRVVEHYRQEWGQRPSTASRIMVVSSVEHVTLRYLNVL